VNLAQIRSAVPEIFDSQSKKTKTKQNKVTDSAKNRTLRSLLHVVTIAKDVLPNIHRTQAADITPGSNGMVPSAAA